MPIASKLVYFQRRPSPPADPDPGPCRDQRRSSLSSRHKPGQEVSGNQRGAAAKPLVGLGGTTTTEQHVGGARLNRSSASDHGRLPDAVQQARERLLQRLNSVDLSGRRRKAWPPESICVSTSRDRVLGSLASCLLIQPGGSVPWCKAQESAAEPVGVVGNNAEKSVAVTVFPRPAHELQHVARRGESVGEGGHEEPPAECPICLERCDGADGLIRLRCRHVFHSSCLERWLRCRRDCPYCRASVLQ